jgi:hypothetical protein
VHVGQVLQVEEQEWCHPARVRSSSVAAAIVRAGRVL